MTEDNNRKQPVAVRFIDLGQMDYKEAWDLQEKLFAGLVEARLHPGAVGKNNCLLFVEHPHVYTLGKSGSENNLLIDYIQLQAKDAAFYRINRGGDITYHGPGQIVGYPIIDMEDFGIGPRRYIEMLEESIIRTLAEYGIQGDRLPGASGVWIDPLVPGRVRKICAIGVRMSRQVTMHGFAFNVNTDLSYFSHINPCGYADKGVTSMEKELGGKFSLSGVKNLLRQQIASVFKMKFLP